MNPTHRSKVKGLLWPRPLIKPPQETLGALFVWNLENQEGDKL